MYESPNTIKDGPRTLEHLASRATSAKNKTVANASIAGTSQVTQTNSSTSIDRPTLLPNDGLEPHSRPLGLVDNARNIEASNEAYCSK